ncbi:MAG: hypothetical protein AAFX85_00750 [Pseudomonadota bacterium]
MNLEDVQRQLEEDMVTGGVTRYYRNLDDEADAAPGRTLLRRTIPLVKAAIETWVSSAREGAGRKHGSLRYMEIFPSDILAYMTCRRVVTALGEDPYRVMEIMGHSSIVVTRRYAHLEVDHLREAMSVLDTPTEPDAGKVVPLRRKR